MTTPPLNFQRAQYEGEPVSQNECAYCGRGFTNEYYRVGGLAACPVCAQQAQSLTPPNSHKVFLHALSLGAAAAVVGCIGYAMIRILTGWTIGYAAIGVGFLIGWAMRKTAGQYGGRRYQWAAALLTYAAVTVSFVPVAIHANNQRIAQQRQVQQQAYASNGASSSAGDGPRRTVNLGTPFSPARYALQIFARLILGLISPVLAIVRSPAYGLLNAFIIAIGVRYAWQMMAVRTVEVDGPFEASAGSLNHLQ